MRKDGRETMISLSPLIMFQKRKKVEEERRSKGGKVDTVARQ
jgi:hypothetical protein